MNIKKRLSKLETEFGTKSEFCECFGRRTETFWQDLGADTNSTEPQPMSEPIPDYCERCRKPIAKDIIIIQGVDCDSEKNFPELYHGGRLNATFNI